MSALRGSNASAGRSSPGPLRSEQPSIARLTPGIRLADLAALVNILLTSAAAARSAKQILGQGRQRPAPGP